MTYDISKAWIIIFIIAVLWDLFWKGQALWRAGQKKQVGWFIAILVINTVGILPMLYLFMTDDGKGGKFYEY